MDVKTVCLGMLSDGKASGYDLKKSFESTFGHFFAAGYGSIYPALSTLAEQGLVNRECIAQDGKPDRKVYEITAAGREHLLRELEGANPCHKVRSEFLVTMWFAHLLPNEQIEKIFASRLEEVDRYIAMFDEIEANQIQDCSPGMRFVVGFGRTMAEAKKKFIEENRHNLVCEPERQATG